MKKALLPLLLLLCCMQSVTAQSIDNLFDAFKNSKNVNYVSLPKSLINFGLKATNDKDAIAVLSKLDKVEILNLEDAEASERQRFQKLTKSMKFKGYETLLTNNDGNDKTRILLKTDKNEVKSVLIINTDGKECNLIRVNGTLKPDELQTLTDTMGDKLLGTK